MNRYTLMVERQKKELYELLGTMPAAYVYNESQLVEGLEKIGLKPDQADKACRVRNTGAIIRKSDAGRLLDLIQHHHNERVNKDSFEVEYDDYLPMWAFNDFCDNYWLDNGGLQIMADCGFRIYEQEDYEYIFGIDGCGYDFYEAHWIPLYKARGLHWHKEDAV